jgi:hypothetical protein
LLGGVTPLAEDGRKKIDATTDAAPWNSASTRI